jgi:hypothetical protein
MSLIMKVLCVCGEWFGSFDILKEHQRYCYEYHKKVYRELSDQRRQQARSERR